MSCLLLCLKSQLEKDVISAGPKKELCPISLPLIHQWFKHRQRTKTNKAMLSTSPSLVFDTKFTILLLKNKYIFCANRNITRITTVEVLNWVSKIYASTDSKHIFHKKGIENWLPIGFNLELITTLCWTTNGKSLEVLYTNP